MAATASILRRMARPAPPPPGPLTPARALRLALQRGAERAAGLSLVGLGVGEDEGPLDDLLSRLEEGLLLRALLGPGGAAVGLVALDAEARAAAVEAQTLGRPAARAAEPREPTAADLALCEPLLEAVLAELAASAAIDGLGPAPPRLGERLPGARGAAMALPDGRYRALRVSVDIGAGGRQGLLALLLRRPAPAPAAPPPPGPGLADQVLRAEAPLVAVLHRLPLPLAEAEGLAVGQVLALPGVTVASVRLECGGLDLGPARLGQVAGLRAVRVEEPLAPRLADLAPSPARAPAPTALPGA